VRSVPSELRDSLFEIRHSRLRPRSQGGARARPSPDLRSIALARICVINVAGLSCRLLGRQGGLWVQSLAARPRPMLATFPSVAASVQTSMTTGVAPGLHGVVAGGVFRRQQCSVGLDERSNTLLSKKRFWHSRRLPRRPSVGLVFWSNPLAGAADAVIGAATYAPSSQLIADFPAGLYERVARSAGRFDPAWVRGPGAGWRASKWIAQAAEFLWREAAPDLLWVYLPGVNFEATRHGLESPQVASALREVDALAAELAGTVSASGGRTLLVSDGGYVPVRRPAFPNDALRRAGLLVTKSTPDGAVTDLEQSRAFAMVDHQIAHVYCRDESAAREAEAAIAPLDGVAAVRRPEELFCEGPGRQRAGERIVLAEADAWLAYPWWGGEEPPAIARQADVAGKCGYDPCELFAGPGEGTIDPRPELVKSSRGLCDVPAEDQCVLAADRELTLPTSSEAETASPRAGRMPAIRTGKMPVLRVTDVPEIVKEALFGAAVVGATG